MPNDQIITSKNVITPAQSEGENNRDDNREGGVYITRKVIRTAGQGILSCSSLNETNIQSISKSLHVARNYNSPSKII